MAEQLLVTGLTAESSQPDAERGGVELARTVVRRAADHFLVIAPASGHTKALALLNRAALDRSVTVTLLTMAARPCADRPVHVRLREQVALLCGGGAMLRHDVRGGGVTSDAYGYIVGAASGLATVRFDLPSEKAAVVDCAGELVPAEVSDTPFRPPAGRLP